MNDEQQGDSQHEGGVASLISSALRGATYEERLEAINALAETRDQRATETLVDVLFWRCDDDFRVVERDTRLYDRSEPSGHPPRWNQSEAETRLRHAAAAVLAKDADPHALKLVLLGQARHGIDFFLGKAVEGVVLSIKTPDVVETLIGYLRRDATLLGPSTPGGSPFTGLNMEEIVATQLGRIGDARAVEGLIDVVNDKKRAPDVRAAAADSLGKLADPQAAEVLGRCLILGEDDHVRLAASNALHHMGGPEATQAFAMAEAANQKRSRGRDHDRQMRALQATKEAEDRRKTEGERKRPRLP